MVTGDAVQCQRATCQQIRDAGGDSLFIIKDNHPQVLADIRTLFADPPPEEPLPQAECRGRHGDRWEVRRLTTSTALTGYLAWPGLQQVGRMERTVVCRQQTTRQVRYFLTSLATDAGPQRLLELKRGHWTIENQVHYVRDVCLGEDASTIRSGAAPRVMATLRNAVLYLLRVQGGRTIRAALRAIGWQQSALALLGWMPS